MELSEAIRTGYFDNLQGAVSAPGFDAFALPEGTPYPYWLVSSQTEVQREVTDGKVYDATVLIDIVTGSMDPIGRDQAEGIADEIEAIINPDNGNDIDISAYGYEIGDTNREQGFDGFARSGSFYIFRKLIRYRHIIHKI